MATNDRTNKMGCSSLLLLCLFFALGISQDVEYQISSSNSLSLVSDARMTVHFAEAARSRTKRQTAPNSPAQTSADSATTGTNGALPDSPNNNNNNNNNNNSNSSSSSSSSNNAGTSSQNDTADAAIALPDSVDDTTDQSGGGTTTTPATTTNLFKDADVIHDEHRYYDSAIFKDQYAQYWEELKDAPKHETLSDGHRMAAVLKLKFAFSFYGHEVSNITVATGGFIYMSPFLHQWLTATQYIAPLMANFDTSMSGDSSIYYSSQNTQFIVEWRDVMLKDQNSTGKFSFQTILRKDNTIVFVYKTIPIPVAQISKANHPVKVGVSDAYYNDTLIKRYNIKRRTIYKYHEVAVNTGGVLSGSVVVLSPKPTCNLLPTCEACIEHIGIEEFDCRWCNRIGRCSDGMDWYRQHWEANGCDDTRIKDVATCATLPAPSNPIDDPHAFPFPSKCVGSDCDKDKHNFPVALIIIIILVVCGLLAALGGWVYYAYTHPTSRSGMWLMENRPSQIKAKIKFWKSNSDSGAKYKTETEA